MRSVATPEKHFGLEQLFRLSAEQDRGFTTALFARMLARFDRLRRDEFDLDDALYEELTRAVRRWSTTALELDRGREL